MNPLARHWVEGACLFVALILTGTWVLGRIMGALRKRRERRDKEYWPYVTGIYQEYGDPAPSSRVPRAQTHELLQIGGYATLFAGALALSGVIIWECIAEMAPIGFIFVVQTATLTLIGVIFGVLGTRYP